MAQLTFKKSVKSTFVFVLVTTVSLLLSQPSLAESSSNADTVTCDQVLSACDEAVNAADYAINKQAETIQALTDQNTRLEKSLEGAAMKLAEKDAWFRKPSIVGPLAFVAGFLLARETK